MDIETENIAIILNSSNVLEEKNHQNQIEEDKLELNDRSRIDKAASEQVALALKNKFFKVRKYDNSSKMF